ncbi:hypothetical protein Ae406Ps2_6422c [Pseudonocardia sp. Ae406_Ps2]|nr:hypothetical protein Ae406Ps2_6422c [Pseudonocardia sp. Ae406_Ps2]
MHSAATTARPTEPRSTTQINNRGSTTPRTYASTDDLRRGRGRGRRCCRAASGPHPPRGGLRSGSTCPRTTTGSTPTEDPPPPTATPAPGHRPTTADHPERST